MKLSEISNFLKCDFIGESDHVITHISSYLNPKENSIVFIEKKCFLTDEILKKSAVIINPTLLDSKVRKGNYILSKNAKIDFAKLTKKFKYRQSKLDIFNCELFPTLDFGKNFLIGKNVSIGENCSFGNNVSIQDNVSIGSNTRLMDNVVICHGSILGDNCTIGYGSIIASEGFGNVFFKNKWLHIHHLGNVQLGNNVSIGSNCNIDRGTIDNTIIEDGVIIDNQVHIAHNVRIGKNTAIAAKVGIAGSSLIGKRNMIGGMVGIVDHIKTSNDVIISATSTVNKDLKEPGTYTGIMPISKHAIWKRIALWITKLDKIAEFLNLKKI